MKTANSNSEWEANMYLEGLTEKDCEILDTMWAIDSREDLNKYLATLNDSDFMRAATLLEMLKLSAVDDEVNAMDTYPEAEMMIRNIMN